MIGSTTWSKHSKSRKSPYSLLIRVGSRPSQKHYKLSWSRRLVNGTMPKLSVWSCSRFTLKIRVKTKSKLRKWRTRSRSWERNLTGRSSLSSTRRKFGRVLRGRSAKWSTRTQTSSKSVRRRRGSSLIASHRIKSPLLSSRILNSKMSLASALSLCRDSLVRSQTVCNALLGKSGRTSRLTAISTPGFRDCTGWRSRYWRSMTWLKTKIIISGARLRNTTASANSRTQRSSLARRRKWATYLRWRWASRWRCMLTEKRTHKVTTSFQRTSTSHRSRPARVAATTT